MSPLIFIMTQNKSFINQLCPSHWPYRAIQIDTEKPVLSNFFIQGNKTLLLHSALSVPLTPSACSAIVTDAVRLKEEKRPVLGSHLSLTVLYWSG